MINDDTYIIPDTEVESTKSTVFPKRFPALAQLAILFVVLAVIFSATFLPGIVKNKIVARNPEIVPDAPLVIAGTSTAIIPIETIALVKVKARSAFVYDVRTKRVLYQKDADAVLPLASITKLMTALVAHELVEAKQTVTIPKAAVQQDGVSGLREGEKMTTQALSDYAVLASSNDAAFALATAVGAVLDPQANANQTFVNSMNIRATELGLPNLTFYNPTGLDLNTTQPGAVGTAREVSFLLDYILANYPSVLEPTTFTRTRVYSSDGAYHDAENTNPIISQIPNLLGSKTGYTDLAGGNLTIAFDAGFNRPIIVTVLGSSYDERFSDVLGLVQAITNALETK